METNNQEHWVEQRLAALRPSEDWQPDMAKGLARLHSRRSPAGGRWWIWAGAAAAAGCLSLLALPAPRALAQYCLQCLAPASVAMQPVIHAGERKPAPDFTLSDAAGHPVQLSTFRGKVVLLDFWATWCGGCKVEIPWFIEFQETYRNRDFAVLGVALDDEGWKPVKPYMEAKQINYRVMIGNDGVTKLFGGMESLPVTMLIDKSGRIAARHSGLGNKAEFQAEIEGLLKERY